MEIIVVADAVPERAGVAADQPPQQPAGSIAVTRSTGIRQPQAWNLAAEGAAGRYLVFLDGDDDFHPDRLEVFRRAHSVCDGFTWGFTGVEAIDEGGRPITAELIRDRTLRSNILASTRPVEALRNLPSAFTPVSCGNLVIDAGAFRDLGGFRDFASFFGWDLALRLLRGSDPVTIERPLFRYRLRSCGQPTDGLSAAEAGLVAQERDMILDDYRLGLIQDGVLDALPAGPGTVGWPLPPDPDARASAAAAAWCLDQLRRVPILYTTARRTARAIKRRQGRSR